MLYKSNLAALMEVTFRPWFPHRHLEGDAEGKNYLKYALRKYLFKYNKGIKSLHQQII